MTRFDDFGVDLKFYHAQDCEKHSHQDIELSYVLEGSVIIGISDTCYTLKKDDVLVVNSGYTHWWQVQGEAFVCVIRIAAELPAKETGADYVTFWCNSVVDRDTDYKDIREIIGKLMAEYSVNMDVLTFRKKALFYQMLDVLLNKYLIESKTKMEIISGDEMFKKVLQYIRENYWRQLGLGEVAAQAYMTNSTFSRYFKKNAGINFLEYLNNLRLQNALEDLLYSDKPLTMIAMDHGFTNPSMFSKAFKAAYNMSPSEYKKAKKEPDSGEKEEIQKQSGDGEALKRFVEAQKNQVQEAVFKRQISVNAESFRYYGKIWNMAVNIGAASELLSAKMQQHVLALRDAIGFKYVRIVNIFSWDMHIRKDRNSRQLNFEFVDNVLDFIVTNKMRPFIEFGDKPKRVFQNLDSLLYMEREEPIFQSMEESRGVIEKFMEHIVQRYGTEEVEQWYFENWIDERADRNAGYNYLDVFDMVYDIIKKRAPMAKVGGCGLELGSEYDEIIEKWQFRKNRPSFFSVCGFPYKRILPGFDVQEKGAQRSTDLHFFRNETRRLKQKLKDNGLDGVPLLYTEWNLSMSDRNYYNDCCGKAAQMLMTMVELLEEADMGIYMYGSDLNVRYYDTQKEFFGGTGLLSKDALPKPSYYAHYFMKRLGNCMIKSGDGYIVTTDGKGSYYVLLFNYKNFNYMYFAKNEEQIMLDDLPDIFSDSDPVEIVLELNHIAEGDYCIKTYNVGIDTSSALNEWRLLGENMELDMSDHEYLKRICIPHIKIRRQMADGGRMVISETLKAHDIRYIHIYR